MNFSSFGFTPEIIRAVERLGFTNATPIQEKAIPYMLAGDTDIIGPGPDRDWKNRRFRPAPDPVGRFRIENDPGTDPLSHEGTLPSNYRRSGTVRSSHAQRPHRCRLRRRRYSQTDRFGQERSADRGGHPRTSSGPGQSQGDQVEYGGLRDPGRSRRDAQHGISGGHRPDSGKKRPQTSEPGSFPPPCRKPPPRSPTHTWFGR